MTAATAEATAADIRDRVSAALSASFLAAQADNPHDPTELSMSGLGGCTRAAAYQVAGTEPSNTPPPEEGRAAMLGEWIHNGLLPRLAAALGVNVAELEVEKPVVLRAAGIVIPGRADLAGDVVLDLKTVGEHRLQGVRRSGEYADHRQQVMGYALACFQAGRRVRWVVWLYIDRATGDHEVIVEPFTNAAALSVVERVREIRSYADEDPDSAPRDGRGPGFSFACDRCPWLRRCWGEDAVPGRVGVQKILAADAPGTVAAIELLDGARHRLSTGKRDEEFAKAVLEGKQAAQYGEWQLRYTRGRSGTDMDQVREHYEAIGEELPQKRGAPSIKVRKVGSS